GVINAGSNSSTLSYGAYRNRYKQSAVTAGVTETTVYIGGILEKVTRSGVTEYRHRIEGGNGTAAIYVRRSSGSPATETYFVHRDQLGSPELITNAAGAVVVRLSFGAYGERRDSDWDGAVSSADMTAIGNTTRRGFTGHEHLDSVNLIHMNGRVYEPVIGRMLSPDAVVQIGSAQSVNCYAYVWNNPLTRTDPSGWVADNEMPSWPLLEEITVTATRIIDWWFPAMSAVPTRGSSVGPPGGGGGGGGGGAGGTGQEPRGNQTPETSVKCAVLKGVSAAAGGVVAGAAGAVFIGQPGAVVPAAIATGVIAGFVGLAAPHGGALGGVVAGYATLATIPFARSSAAEVAGHSLSGTVSSQAMVVPAGAAAGAIASAGRGIPGLGPIGSVAIGASAGAKAAGLGLVTSLLVDRFLSDIIGCSP
ncbi:MAG: hypothetical protein EPO25_17655, partial [Gammaproteobacteria bacterium]